MEYYGLVQEPKMFQCVGILTFHIWVWLSESAEKIL